MITSEIKRLEYYRNLPYTIRLQQQEDGWYAEIEELPGCIAAADTREAVLDVLEEAKDSWLMISLQDGVAIPEPKPIV